MSIRESVMDVDEDLAKGKSTVQGPKDTQKKAKLSA